MFEVCCQIEAIFFFNSYLFLSDATVQKHNICQIEVVDENLLE